ncbi:MAG: cation:proton antiporter [Acidimicrobiales bacterium]
MELLLAFAALLLLAVLVSSLAHRTVLSTAALFLVGGFVLGDSSLGVLDIQPGDQLVAVLAELALFSVLFSDGMRVGLPELRRAWRLPGRALVFGLPLTMALTAVFAHVVAGLPWLESFLLGAALSPTDPVLAAAIMGREEIPYRLRHLLNVESGLNDGLALPVVVILLATASSSSVNGVSVVTEVLAGVALGVAVPYVAIRLERTRFFSATTFYEPLNAFAIGLLVLALALLTHANVFLAAFSSGITIATMSPELRAAFHQFGELVAELLKLGALIVFGALISIRFLGEIGISGYGFAALALFAARPIALGLALLRSTLNRKERLAAAWFGPKGFASVVYALLILEAGLASSDELFHLAALVITASILAHSSTDVLVARRFAPRPSPDTNPDDTAAPVDTTTRPDDADHVPDVGPDTD